MKSLLSGTLLAGLVASFGAAAPVFAQTTPAPLVLTVAGKPAITFSASALAKAPRQTVRTTDRDGQPHTYAGIPLHQLLADAGVRMDCRGDAISQVVSVRSQDGFRAVLSIAEVSPELAPQVVLLADSRDGQPLATTSGPWQLIVPGDRKPTRWVRQVQQLSVGLPAAEVGK